MSRWGLGPSVELPASPEPAQRNVRDSSRFKSMRTLGCSSSLSREFSDEPSLRHRYEGLFGQQNGGSLATWEYL